MALMSKNSFLEMLKDLAAWVEADDSYEGSLVYELRANGDYEVAAALRFGNSEGQGSLRMIKGEKHDEPDEVQQNETKGRKTS